MNQNVLEGGQVLMGWEYPLCEGRGIPCILDSPANLTVPVCLDGCVMQSRMRLTGLMLCHATGRHVRTSAGNIHK